MIVFGIVTEMDTDAGKARVKLPAYGNVVSDWMSVVVPNTKEHKWSFPLSLDEHVACVMDDKFAKGVILGAVYSKVTTPEITGGKYGVKFSDDTQVEFDPANGKLTVHTSGEIEITATSKLTLNGDLKVNGKIDATGEVAAKAGTPAQVRLSTHLHPTPAGPSSAPTPGT